jgi:hypothetical protein
VEKNADMGGQSDRSSVGQIYSLKSLLEFVFEAAKILFAECAFDVIISTG